MNKRRTRADPGGGNDVQAIPVEFRKRSRRDSAGVQKERGEKRASAESRTGSTPPKRDLGVTCLYQQSTRRRCEKWVRKANFVKFERLPNLCKCKTAALYELLAVRSSSLLFNRINFVLN